MIHGFPDLLIWKSVMANRYELSAVQWRRVCDILPGKPGDRGRCGEDNRLFVNGRRSFSALRI